MAIWDYQGNKKTTAYNRVGLLLPAAFNYMSDKIFPDAQKLEGGLYKDSSIVLPDIYNNGKGWTCTGLAYDETSNTFLVGDIGAMQPGDSTRSQIVRVSFDFSDVIEIISLYDKVPNVGDVQGITTDSMNNSIWFCTPSKNKIYQISKTGDVISNINISKPTGIAYDQSDDSLWVLTYDNNILHITKSGETISTYNFAYSETLDQCYLDSINRILYITAGNNYNSRNNIYALDLDNGLQSIACTVDSYAVEGLWIGINRLVILNDGYYHDAVEPNNQVNIYNLVPDIYKASHQKKDIWSGGYIEIQPDSWDGVTAVTGDAVSPNDSTAWGFPMSLSAESKAKIKAEFLCGEGYGISFVRFPMGFAYRGYRNIDVESGLAKNIGQRWEGQNAQLKEWLSNISDSGGGLSVEYWCPAPYWLTGGAYYNENIENQLWAGGNYAREVTLESIKYSDPEQYWRQIEAYTDAVLNDLEYLHQEIAPVRMYTLATEPTGSGQLKYGHCHWGATVYNDIFAILHPKVVSSTVLATYNGKKNEVLMHLCADDTGFAIGYTMLESHPEWVWGYSHDVMRPISGENGIGADQTKVLTWPNGSNQNWKNVFVCEYEYFSTTSKTPQYRFANNVVRMVLEIWFRRARVSMPVIHICKPENQTSSQTNTPGYCLYSVNLSDGSITPNAWAYNSWKMFNDNIPVGCEIVAGGDGGNSNFGYALLRDGNHIILIFGNSSSASQSVELDFSNEIRLIGKKYDISNLGVDITEKIGTNIVFTIPPYSGVVYKEE